MLCDLNHKFKCYGKHKGEKYRNFILQGIHTGQNDKVGGCEPLCCHCCLCPNTVTPSWWEKQTNKQGKRELP